MDRFVQSRSFWFKVVCLLCLAFGIMIQVLDRVREAPSPLASSHPIEAHAPGGGPVNPDPE